ncbi:DUF3168 domain-containing protein [Pannonibacter sp. Q-1]
MTGEMALRDALIARLSTNADLTLILGVGHVHDGAPRSAAHPYLTLESITSRPLAGEPDEGMEHQVVLALYSRADSRDEAVKGVKAAAEALFGSSLSLNGWHLADLRAVETSSERLRDGRSWRAALRLRAVTGPED